MSLFKAILFPLLLPVTWAACTDVHLFLARGNGEGYPGRVGALYNTVCNGLPSCDYENILFDSSQSYCAQASSGVSSGLSQIAAYASACPNSKLVLGGYSLGAQIVGDILGGGGGSYYGCSESPSTAMSANSFPGNKISAVLLFGDVRHVANEPYNVGAGSGDNGQYPRSGTSLSDLDEYSSKMQSYCLVTDPICALGNDGESHTTYMTVYADSAGAWVQKILASGSAANSPTSTPSATSKATSAGISTPTTTPSSGVQTAAGTTTFSTATSTAMTLTPGVMTSSPTSSVNSATFAPFVFSNTTTAASTPTSISTAPTSPLSFTATTTTATSSHSNTTFTGSQLPTFTQSNGGAYFPRAEFALSLVTLVVVGVLAF